MAKKKTTKKKARAPVKLHPLEAEARRMVDAIMLAVYGADADVANRGAHIAKVFQAATGRAPSAEYLRAVAPLPAVTRTLEIETPYATIFFWLDLAAHRKHDAAWVLDRLREQGLVRGEADASLVDGAIRALAGESRRHWVLVQDALATITGTTPPHPRSLARMARAWRKLGARRIRA